MLVRIATQPWQDHFLEVLSQILEQVVQLSRERRVALPPHLVVVADNTVAAVKNAYGLRFLAYLVGQNLFRSTTLFSLMVGHTHEDPVFLLLMWCCYSLRLQTFCSLDCLTGCGPAVCPHQSIFEGQAILGAARGGSSIPA